MTSIIANGGNDTPSYPTVSVGVHKARCVRVIDLGTQQNDYQGQISWKRQVMLIWEVPSETNNKVIFTQNFTSTNSFKTSKVHLDSLRRENKIVWKNSFIMLFQGGCHQVTMGFLFWEKELGSD